MRIGVVFPGQGSQTKGMGADVAAAYPAAAALYREAKAILGYDLLALCASGDEDQLRETRYSQPAIFVTNLALAAAVGDALAPVVSAGHSFAEYCSLTLAGSLSFEEALVADGIEVRHIALNCNVPMYRTNIPCVSAGVFSGPMVVSMRPMKPADAIRAVQITSRFPSVHGAPVHLGMPEQIGIKDIARPDYGDAVPVGAGELPVFWACGVTPQAVIAQVRPEFCITHAPGSMLITDLRNTKLAVL